MRGSANYKLPTYRCSPCFLACLGRIPYVYFNMIKILLQVHSYDFGIIKL